MGISECTITVAKRWEFTMEREMSYSVHACNESVIVRDCPHTHTPGAKTTLIPTRPHSVVIQEPPPSQGICSKNNIICTMYLNQADDVLCIGGGIGV